MPVVDTSLLRWIVLLPLIGSAVCTMAAATGRNAVARAAGPLSVLGAFVVSLVAVARLWAQPAGASLLDHLYTWIHAAPLTLEMALRVDALSSVMILIVTGIGFLIHVYSIGYMHDDPDYARFFAYLNLFCGSMLMLVLGDCAAGHVHRLGGRRPLLLPADRLLVRRRRPTPSPAARRSSSTASATSAS